MDDSKLRQDVLDELSWQPHIPAAEITVTADQGTSGAGLPFAPLGFAVALVVEIGLGLLLAIGYRTRAVAFGLAIWCVVTAIFFHRNFADQNMMIHFLKNLMMAGGLLQIVHFGAGAVSLDARAGR